MTKLSEMLLKQSEEQKERISLAACFRSGMGNLFVIVGRMNCALSLAGRKIHQFHPPEILPLSNFEEERHILTYYL